MNIKPIPYAGIVLSLFWIFAPQAHGAPASALASTPLFQGLTYQGRFLDADGTTAMTDVIDLILGIYSQDGNCLLYEERQNGIDLSVNSGLFSVHLGSEVSDPKRTSRDPQKSLNIVFSNSGQIVPSSATCSMLNGYTPGPGEARKLRVTLIPHNGPQETLVPDLVISPVAQATVAETLQGLLPDDLVQVAGNVSQEALETLTAGASSSASSLHNHDAQYAKLSNGSSMALGTNQLFGFGNYTGAPGSVPAGVHRGDTWFDSNDNKVKYWDGTQAIAVGQGMGSITSGDITTALGFTPANSTTVTTALAGKEPSIAVGTTSQWFRGDKTWQALNTDLVIEGSTNKYYSSAQAKAALTGTLPIDYSITTGAIGIKGLSALGTSDQLLGMKGDASQVEYKTITGTNKRVSVAHSAGSITLSAPQDIDSAATPTFAGMTLTGALTLPAGDPVANEHATSKAYVDSQLAAKQSSGTYLTGLTGDVTATGPGTVSATVSNSAVIGKVLTGLNASTGGSVVATDTLIQAFGKLENRTALNDAKTGFTDTLARNAISASAPLGYNNGTGALSIVAASGTSAGTMSVAHYLDLTNASSGAGNSTLVKRDPSGNFAAGTITANLTGNVTGNVTGNITGDVTGNVSGTASNITGVAAVANGGTGATTAQAAFNALAPAQASQSGKFLTTDGANASWATINGSQWISDGSGKISYSGGNVGIGVASPASALDIAGSINATGSLTTHGGNLVVDSYGVYANYYDPPAGGAPGKLRNYSHAASTSNTVAYQVEGYTKTNTSGTYTHFQLIPGYNQASGTAANTDFLINRTETAVGSGIQRLISAGTGGASYTEKFGVSNTGAAYIAGTLGIGVTSPTSTLQVKGSTSDSSASALNVTNSSGNSVLFVRNDYRVGINTTNPVTNLHVSNGSIGQDGSRSLAFLESSGTSNNYYGLQVGSSTGMHLSVTNAGNIGIGTTNPGAKLDVVGDVSITSGRLYSSGIQNLNFLNFGNILSNLFQPTSALTYNNTAGYTWLTGPGWEFDSVSTGARGLWSFGPSYKARSNTTMSGSAVLTTFNIAPVFGNGAAFTYNSDFPMTAFNIAPIVNVNVGSTTGYSALTINPTETSIGSGTKNLLIDAQVGGAKKFNVDTAGNGHFAGNVGIGNTNPTELLDIKSNFSGNATIHVKNVADDVYASPLLWLEKTNSGADSAVEFSGPDSDWMVGTLDGPNFSIYDSWWGRNIIVLESGAPVNSFYMTSAGYFGIGTTTPSEKLEINGNAKAAAFLSPSDRRLKKNIHPIEDALDKVSQLHGVTYEWKTNDKIDIGVIAQELEKVFPEAVATDSDGFKSVKYGNLVAPLIEAVKTLYSKFISDSSEKDRKIAALAEENARLRSRIERIEKLLDTNSGEPPQKR